MTRKTFQKFTSSILAIVMIFPSLSFDATANQCLRAPSGLNDVELATHNYEGTSLVVKENPSVEEQLHSLGLSKAEIDKLSSDDKSELFLGISCLRPAIVKLLVEKGVFCKLRIWGITKFTKYVAPNLNDWYEQNQGIIDDMEAIVENSQEFSQMLTIFNFVPMQTGTIKKYFAFIRHLGCMSGQYDSACQFSTIREFQPAIYLFCKFYQNGWILKEEVDNLLLELFEEKTDVTNWIKKVSTIIEKKQQNVHGENIELEGLEKWQKILINGIVGFGRNEERKRKIEDLNYILRHLDITPSDFLLGLCYASNLMYDERKMIDKVPRGYHKKHDFKSRYNGFSFWAWRNGGYRKFDIKGCIFALPSEIGHLMGEIAYSQKQVKDKYREVEDRIFAIAISIEPGQIESDGGLEFVNAVYQYGRSLIQNELENEKVNERILQILNVLQSRGRFEESSRLIKANKTAELLKHLDKLEIYFIGRKICIEERGVSKYGIKNEDWRLKAETIRKQISKKEIVNTIGVLTYSTLGVNQLKEIPLKPYTDYIEKHEIAERLSQEFMIQLAISLAEAGVPGRFLPYMIRRVGSKFLSHAPDFTDIDSVIGFMKEEITRESILGIAQEMGIMTEEKEIPKPTLPEISLMEIAARISGKIVYYVLEKKNPPIKNYQTKLPEILAKLKLGNQQLIGTVLPSVVKLFMTKPNAIALPRELETIETIRINPLFKIVEQSN